MRVVVVMASGFMTGTDDVLHKVIIYREPIALQTAPKQHTYHTATFKSKADAEKFLKGASSHLAALKAESGKEISNQKKANALLGEISLILGKGTPLEPMNSFSEKLELGRAYNFAELNRESTIAFNASKANRGRAQFI